MKILFYRYGSICEPDIIEGFEELGIEVSQITEEITNKNLVFGDSARIVSNYLLDHPHDAVFSVNFFPIVSDVCNIFKIPYISWTVDSPVMELFSKSIANPCNRVFLFDRIQYNEINPLNPGHIFHFPLAVNIKSKQNAIEQMSVYNHAKYTSDISFVGSLYTEKCPYDKLTNAPEYLNGYLNGLMEAQIRIYGYYFIEELLPDDIVAEFKNHLPNFYQYPMENFLTDRMIMAQLYIGNKITAIERIRTMKLLSKDFAVDLYTGSDTSALPAVNNRGFAKSLTEMPVIFNESKINLNTTCKAIRSGLPQRIFDIMGCGGFVLSNYQAEIPDLFEPGIDIITYASMEEMNELAAYYLSHDNERREIAHNGYEKVLHNYTYPIRLAQLLELAYSVK